MTDISEPMEGKVPDASLLARLAAHAAGLAPLEGLAAPIVLRERSRDAVLEYRVPVMGAIVAKRYADPDALLAGMHAFDLLSDGATWPSDLRVPELVGVFPGLGVLLMRRADGVPLPALVDRPGDWHSGLRGAGRWLARLHREEDARAPGLDTEAIMGRLERRVARVAACRPEAGELLGGLLADIGVLATGERVAHTLTHGRYHPGHVFVGDGIVTVIDLDRFAAADRGRDLGEFLARLSMVRSMRHDVRARDAAVSSFARAYREDGGVISSTLVFHWAGALLWIMAHLIEEGHPRLARRIDHLLAELRTIPERAAAITGGASR